MKRDTTLQPRPAKSTHAARWVGVLVIAALGTTVAISPAPAAAAEAPADECDRIAAVTAWQYGGAVVREAAEETLLGTEDAVCAFEAELAQLQAIDERVEANQMLSAGGPAVRAAAQEALDSEDPEALAQFLNSGWTGPSAVDQRTQVNQMLASGGSQVRAAAQRALDSDDEGAIAEFLSTGWETPFWTDQRLRVLQILAKAAEDSEVARLAQRALDAPDREALTEFLLNDWAIAAARDQERQSIADLTLAAQVAAELASAETFAAIDESEIAVAEAAAAKASAEAARQEASAAGNDAAAAVRAAQSAAAAADKAAVAAQRAVSAAHSASEAARTAASAAARASSAASRAGDEAVEAYEAAGRAATDEQAAQAARTQAERASAAASGAHAAQERALLAKQAGDRALAAGRSAESAATNANLAVDAANAAADLLAAADFDASEAYAAANRARSSAQRATRAAQAAVTFANQASAAANDAQLAANRAANHANAAAAAARDAAEHAGESIDAAQRATEYAKAAEQAAIASVRAASDAHNIYDAARAADEARIQVGFEQGQAAAIRAAAIVEQMQDNTPLFNSPHADRWSTKTRRMIAEVQDPATAPEDVAEAARAVTLEMAQSEGSWIKEGALEALTLGTEAIVVFVRDDLMTAAGMDDRATLAGLMVNGTEAMRAAAQAALDGTDAQVAAFLREPEYPQRAQEDRLAVNQILAEAQADHNVTVAEHAQRALDDGSDTAMREFLERGAATAAAVDRRIKINQILVDEASGPELRNAAQVALDGPPGLQVEFLSTARHKATQADMDAAAHDAIVSALLAEASQSAYDALKDAMEAHEVAAIARGAAEAAVGYALDAQEAADTADQYAQQAQKSANEARASADRAAQSARTAANAAQSANNSARDATRSALWAQASVVKAANFADQARQSAEQALDAALGAGQSFDAAKKAAEDAFAAAQARAVEELEAWTQAQRNQCVSNGGDPERCNASVEEFLKNPTGTAFINAGSCPPLIEDFNEELYATCVAYSVQPDALFEQDMNLHMTIAALEIMGAYARALADATLTVGLTALNLTGCRGWCSVVAEGLGLVADPSSALDREPVETALERLVRRFGVVIIRSKAVNTAAQVEGRSDRSRLSQALIRAHCSPNSRVASTTLEDAGHHPKEVARKDDLPWQPRLAGWAKIGASQPESLLRTSADMRAQGTCSMVAINDPNDPLSQAAFRHRMETIRIPPAQELKNIAVARVRGREHLIIATSDKTGHAEMQIINQLRPGERIEALYSEREPCLERCGRELQFRLTEDARISWTVLWNWELEFKWVEDIAILLDVVRPLQNENLRRYMLKALEMSEEQAVLNAPTLPKSPDNDQRASGAPELNAIGSLAGPGQWRTGAANAHASRRRVRGRSRQLAGT